MRYSVLMKKTILSIIIGLLFVNYISGQIVDTIIVKNAYISYFSFELKAPIYNTYYLYKGGGDSKRTNFKHEYRSAENADYAKSGYDRGHLVSAEDFAYNQSLENQTFSYYNCFPQNKKLNRGPWKSWEMKIREESQLWPLKIYVGGIYGNKKIKNSVAIPDYCWKVVYNQKTHLILHVLIFKNDNSCETNRLTLEGLKQKLKTKIVFNSN